MESDISFSLDPVPGGVSAISPLQQTTGTLAKQGTGIYDSAITAPVAVASQTVCLGSVSSFETDSDISLTLDPVPVAAVSSQPPKSSTTTCTAQAKDDASGSTTVGPAAKTTQVAMISDAKTYASASRLSHGQTSNSKSAGSPTSTNISLDMSSIPSKMSTSTCAVQDTTGNNESTGKAIATLPRSRHKSDGIQPGWNFDDTEDSVAVLEPALYYKVSLCRKRFQEYLDKLSNAMERDADNQSRTEKLQYITSQERKKGSFAIFRYNYRYRREDRAILNRPISGYVENSYSSVNSSVGISHDAGLGTSAIADIPHQRNLCPQQYARIVHERPSRTRYTQNSPSLLCSPTIDIPEGHCQSRHSASADRAGTSTGINHERSIPTRRSYDDGGIPASTSTEISHERDVVDRRFYDAHGQVRTYGPNLYPQQFGDIRSNANATSVHGPPTDAGYIHNYHNAFYSSNTWGPDWFYHSSYPGQANTRTGITHESNPYPRQHEGIPIAPDARIVHEMPTRIGDIQNYANPFYSSNCWVPDWVLQSDYPASAGQTNHPTGISYERNVPTRSSYDAGVRTNVSASHESSVAARRFYNADLRAGTNTDSSNERNAATHRFTLATTRATGSAGAKSDIIVIDDDDNNDDDDVIIVENEDPSSIWRGRGPVEIVDSSEEEGEAEEAEEGGKQAEDEEATAEDDDEDEKENETAPKQGKEKGEEQEVVEVTMYEYEDNCGIWSTEPTRDSVDDFEWQEIDNEIFYAEFELMVRKHLSERLLWYDESMNIAPNLRDRMFGRCVDADTHLHRFFEKLLNFIVGRRGLNTIEWRYFFKRCFDWLKIIKICYKFPLIYNKIIAYWFAKFLAQYAVHIVLCSDDNFIIENAVISQMHSLLDGDVRAVGLTLLHMEMFRDLAIPLYRSIVNEFFMCHVSEWDVELYVIVLLCIMKWASFQRPSRIMKDISCPEFLNLPSNVPPRSQTEAEYGPVFGAPSLPTHRTRKFLVQQLYIPEAIQKFFQIYLESLEQASSGEQSMEESRHDRDRNHEQMNPDGCRAETELDQPRRRGQNYKSSKSLSTHLTNECDTKRAKISTLSCNSKQMNSVAFKKNSDINLCKKSNGGNSVDIIEIDLIHDEIENSQAYKPKSDSSESPLAHKPGNLKKFSLSSKNINNGSTSASHNISVIGNTISIVRKNSNKTLESLYRGKKAATSSSDCHLESLYEMLDTHAPIKKRKNKTPQSVPRAYYSNSLDNTVQNLKCRNKTLSSLYGNTLSSDVHKSIYLDNCEGEKQISNSSHRSCESDLKTCNSDSKKTDIRQVFSEVSEPLAHSNILNPYARDKPNSSGVLDVLHRGRKGSNDTENSISQSNNTTLRHLYGREFLSNIRQSRTQNSQKRSYREICTVVLESSSDEESSVEKPSLLPDKLANVSTVPSTMSAKTATNSDCLKKVLSIPEQCRSIMESIATKPTRKEKHCIQGEVSSTTSHDNVVASNGHIASSPDSEFLEVHSTDDYQNARVVGTVNVVEQPNSSFQSVNETREPGRVLLGIDYSDDDDEDDANDDTNDGDFLTGGYWKVIEEATSSTEITHRTQSSEVIVLSALVNSAARPSTADSVMREKISFPENISSCSNYLGNTTSAQSNESPRLTTKKTTNDKAAVIESPSVAVKSKSISDIACTTSRKIRSYLNSESVGKDESRKRIGASVLKELSEDASVPQQGERTNKNANQSITAQCTKPITIISGISEKNSESVHNVAVSRIDELEQHPEEAEVGIEANSAVDRNCVPVNAESDEAADVEKMLADIDENLRKASEIDIKYRKEVKPDNVDLGSTSLPDESTNAIEKSVIEESSDAACETLLVHVGGELSNALEADNYASKLADDSSNCKIDESVEILDDRVAVVKQTTIKSAFSEKETEPTGNRSHSDADHENENTSNALECVRSVGITETATCSSLSVQGRQKKECSSVEEFILKSPTPTNKHLELGAGKSNMNDSVTSLTKSKVLILDVKKLPDNCEENKPTDVEESRGDTTETFKKEEESLKTSKTFAFVNVVDVLNAQKIKSMNNRETTAESYIASEIKEKTRQSNCPARKGDNNVNIVESNESVKGKENLSLKSETDARSCDAQKCQHKSDVNTQIDAASEIIPYHRGKDEQLKSSTPDTGNTDCKQQISASDSNKIIIDSRDTMLLRSDIPNITHHKEIPDKDFSEIDLQDGSETVPEIDLNGIKSKSRSQEITDSGASESKHVESECLMNDIENKVRPVANLESPTSVSNSTCSNHSETNKIEKSVENIALNSDNNKRQSNTSEPDLSEISIDSSAHVMPNISNITQEEDKEILAKHCNSIDTENNDDLLSENVIHETSTGINSQEIQDYESLVADHKKVEEGEDLLRGYNDTVQPLVNRKLISSIAPTLSRDSQTDENDKFVEDISLNSDKTRTDSNKICVDSNVYAITDTEISTIRQDKDTSAKQCSRENLDNNSDLLPENDLHENSVPKGECKIGSEKIEVPGVRAPDHKKVGKENECLLKGIENTIQSQANYEFSTSLSSTLSKNSQIDNNNEHVESTTLNSQNTDCQCPVSQSEPSGISKDPRACVLPVTPIITQDKKLSAEHCSKNDLSSSSDPNITQDKELSAGHCSNKDLDSNCEPNTTQDKELSAAYCSKKDLALDSNSVQLSENILCANGLGKSECKISFEEISKSETITPDHRNFEEDNERNDIENTVQPLPLRESLATISNSTLLNQSQKDKTEKFVEDITLTSDTTGSTSNGISKDSRVMPEKLHLEPNIPDIRQDKEISTNLFSRKDVNNGGDQSPENNINENGPEENVCEEKLVDEGILDSHRKPFGEDNESLLNEIENTVQRLADLQSPSPSNESQTDKNVQLSSDDTLNTETTDVTQHCLKLNLNQTTTDSSAEITSILHDKKVQNETCHLKNLKVSNSDEVARRSGFKKFEAEGLSASADGKVAIDANVKLVNEITLNAQNSNSQNKISQSNFEEMDSRDSRDSLLQSDMPNIVNEPEILATHRSKGNVDSIHNRLSENDIHRKGVATEECKTIQGGIVGIDRTLDTESKKVGKDNESSLNETRTAMQHLDDVGSSVSVCNSTSSNSPQTTESVQIVDVHTLNTKSTVSKQDDLVSVSNSKPSKYSKTDEGVNIVDVPNLNTESTDGKQNDPVSVRNSISSNSPQIAESAQIVDVPALNTESTDSKHNEPVCVSNSTSSNSPQATESVQIVDVHTLNTKSTVSKQDDLVSVSNSKPSKYSKTDEGVNIVDVPNLNTESTDRKQNTSQSDSNAISMHSIDTSQSDCLTIPEDRKICSTSPEESEIVATAYKKFEKYDKYPSNRTDNITERLPDWLPSANTASSIFSKNAVIDKNVKPVQDTTLNVENTDPDNQHISQSNSDEISTVSAVPAKPTTLLLQSDIPLVVKRKLPKSSSTKTRMTGRVEVRKKSILEKSQCTRKPQISLAASGIDSTSTSNNVELGINEVLVDGDSSVVQKDGPLSNRSQNTRGKSIHFDRKRIREDESVSRKMLSVEDVEKRTPWKMRIKRRISQCSDINKEFNIESDDEVKSDRHKPIIRHESADEAVHELAFGIAKLDISNSQQQEGLGSKPIKSDLVSGSCFTKSQPSCSANDSDTPNAGKDDLSSSLQAANMSNVHSVASCESNCVDLSQEQNTFSEQTHNDANERHSLDHMPSNYNSEEILVVTTLINMRNNYAKQLCLADSVVEEKDAGGQVVSKPEELACDAIVPTTIVKPVGLKSILRNGKSTNSIKKKVRYDLTPIVINCADATTSSSEANMEMGMENTSCDDREAYHDPSICVRKIDIGGTTVKVKIKTPGRKRGPKPKQQKEAHVTSCSMKPQMKKVVVRIKRLKMETIISATRKITDRVAKNPCDVAQAPVLKAVTANFIDDPKEAVAAKEPVSQSENVNSEDITHSIKEGVLADLKLSTENNCAQSSPSMESSRNHEIPANRNKHKKDDEEQKTAQLCTQSSPSVESVRRHKKIANCDKHQKGDEKQKTAQFCVQSSPSVESVRKHKILADCDKHQKGDKEQKTAQLCAQSSPSVEFVRKHKITTDCDKHQKGDEEQNTAQLCAQSSPSVESARKQKIPADCDEHQKGDEEQKTAQLCAQCSPSMDSVRQREIPADCYKHQKGDVEQKTAQLCAQSSPSVESVKKQKILADCDKHQKGDVEQNTAQICAQSSPSVESVRKHKILADCDKHQKGDVEQNTAQLCAQSSPSMESVRKHKILEDCDKHQKGDEEQKIAQLCAQSSPSVESVRKLKIAADCDKHQKGDEEQETAQLCAQSSPSMKSIRKHKILEDCDKHQKGDVEQKTAQLCAQSSPSMESVRQHEIPADCGKYQKGDEEQKTAQLCAQSSPSVESVRKHKILADCDKHQKGDEEQKTAQLCTQSSPSVESVRIHKIPANSDKHQKSDEAQKIARLLEVEIKAEPADDGNAIAVSEATSVPTESANIKEEIETSTYCDPFVDSSQYYYDANLVRHSKDIILRPTDVILTEEIVNEQAKAQCYKESQRAKARRHQLGKSENLKKAHIKLSKVKQGDAMASGVRTKERDDLIITEQPVATKLAKVAQKSILKAATENLSADPKETLAAEEPVAQSEDVDSEDITHSITQGVLADLKLLSSENHCALISPSVESVRHSEKPANCDKHQKCDEEQKTAQLLDSSIEIVLGNSCFAKADASGLKPQLAGAVKANADSTFNTPANEGVKRTSPLKGRLDILTAEKINSSIEKILEHKSNFCKDIESGPCVEASQDSQTGIHSKQDDSTGTDVPFRVCSKVDEDFSKKAAKKSLNDVKVISANVPEALFADDESENSNSEEVKDDEKFFAPILCLEPINELPNKSCSEFKEKDATARVHESGDRNTLATPNFTIETEVKLTTQQCDKPAGGLSMEGKTSETPKDKAGSKSDADELNANLEVTEVAFSLPAIAEISAIDIPNDLSITNDYPDLLDAMLFEQVRQSMDCMISGTNSAKKWSQDCFTSSNGPNMGQTEVGGRIENNADISGGAAEKGADASETKETTLNEDALGIGQDSFLGTISPLDEVEVSTTTGFDLVGSFTMEDFLADGSGDFFSFSELDKTQSRSNSFSNDSVICTPEPPDAVADIDDDEHMEIVQSVACDHSYNKYFMTVEEPESRKVTLAKSLPINSTPLPHSLPHGKSISSSPNKSSAESPSPMFSKSKCHPKPFWKVIKNDDMETSTPKKNDEKTFDDSQTSAFSTFSSSEKEEKGSSSNDGAEGNQFLNMPVLETNSSLAGANVTVEVAASNLLSAPKDVESSNNVKPTTGDNIDDKMLEIHTHIKKTEKLPTTIPHVSAPVNDISKGPWPEENLCKKEDALPVEKCAKKTPIEITEIITIAPPIITQPIIRIQSQTNRLERIDPEPTIAQPNYLNSTSEPENELIEIQRACEANVTFKDSTRDSSTPTLDERTKDDDEDFGPETINTNVPIESEESHQLKQSLQKICPKRPLESLADVPPPKKHCYDTKVTTPKTNEIFNILQQEESLQKQLVTTEANEATNLTETVTISPQRKTAVAEIAPVGHTTATNLSQQIQPQIPPQVSPQISPQIPPQISPQISPQIPLQIPPQIPLQIPPQIPPSIDKVKFVETLDNTKREVKSAEVKRTSSNISPASSSDAVSFVAISTNIDQSSQIVQSGSNLAVLQSSPAQNCKAKRNIEAAAEPNANENMKRRNSCEVSAQKNQNGTPFNTASIKQESMRRNSSSTRVRTEAAIGSDPLCLGENPKPCQPARRQSVSSSVSADSVREVNISVASSRAEELAQPTSKAALKHPLGAVPRALGYISEKRSPHAKPVFGVLETPTAKIESSTPSPNYSPISPSVRHNLERTSPASTLSAKNRVQPYQKFTSTPTSYKSKYVYQRDAVPSLADSVHTNVSSQRSEAGKTLKNAQPANAANPSYSAGLNISAIKLSPSDEAMIVSKLESYRGTLPQAKTYKEHRENQRLIKLQEEKLKLEFLEKEKRRQAQHLLAEAQRLKRKSHAESYESHYKKFAFSSGSTFSNSRYTSQHLQQQQPQQHQHQRYKQRQKYVNKFSEIEKQVVGSKKFAETKAAHRGGVSAPLTTSTAWEPKSASVDEIIEHLTKLRKS